MRAFVCAGLSLLAVGCGPSSFDDFRNQLVDKWCTRQVRCGAIGASERVNCAPPVEILDAISPSGVDVVAALKAGRMRFVSSGAQDCLDAVNGAPCDNDVLAGRAADRCHDVVQPNLEPGKTCLGRGECVGGACVPDKTGCSGTCTAFGPPGHPCDSSGALETSCDQTVQYCGVQSEAPDLGAPDGGAPPPTRVCLRHRSEGDKCFRDEECPFGLVCLETCRRLPSLSKGDVCGSPGTLCTDDTYCDATSHCVVRLGAGAPCGYSLACKDRLACVGFQPSTPMMPAVNGSCQAWLDVGAACTSTQVSSATGCPSDTSCGDPRRGPPPPGTSATCQSFSTTSRAGLNQPCASASDCTDGLACDGTRCRFALGLGGDCSGANASLCAPALSCDGKSCQQRGSNCPM